jgi:tRNA modification GTPase
MLVERMIEGGARAAEPGEFTARAFLSGAMDLTQVEAVAAVIRARSDAQLRAAQRLADGRLAGLTDSILDQLAELVALVEADIDFAEEPIEFITPAELRSRLDVICGRLRGLLERAESSERVDVLPRVMLIGEPNAGKSALMNRLTGIDRAICSPVAGTTRDLLSAPVRLGRGEAVLLDAAGVEDGMSGLLREAAAIAADTAKTCDALCLVVDCSREVDRQVIAVGDDAGGIPCVVVANKIDLLDSAAVARCVKSLEAVGRGAVCAVSARTGEGVEACRQLIGDALDLREAVVGGDAVLMTARHREAVEAALGALQRCAEEAGGIDATIDRADILAFELREALESLGSVEGSVTTDDLLGRVFSSFCIGK